MPEKETDHPALYCDQLNRQAARTRTYWVYIGRRGARYALFEAEVVENLSFAKLLQEQLSLVSSCTLIRPAIQI